MFSNVELFDSHLHIIDPRFPLTANNGYLPEAFTCNDYLHHMSAFTLAGGAVVSGSFQAFDQSYLVSALNTLGPNFVGVTQLQSDVSDDVIMHLDGNGVRALRFNLYRGGSESLAHLVNMAHRVYELAKWHIELYVDSSDLEPMLTTLTRLPAVSIDHLGLRKSGLGNLLALAEQGIKIKATGFGRVDFDVSDAVVVIHNTNPEALMFGTDLPSTRAPIPFQDSDISRVQDALGDAAAARVFRDNAVAFYRPAGYRASRHSGD